MYQFIFSPVALIEFKDATVWYKERSSKAAENFVQQVQVKIDKICYSPFRYPKIYKHFRETPLRRYPYSIIYSLNEDEKLVIITSVFHHKRNPRKKYPK